MKALVQKFQERLQERQLKSNNHHIHLGQVQFAYRKGNSLLNALNLDLQPGHIYGLLGRNGAGKTTLLKVIAGLCFPGLGEVSVFGFIPKERKPAFLEQLFFMPENFNVPNMTALAYQKYYGVFYPKFDVETFKRVLFSFGLSEMANISELSHGQKKMFMMAFALATRVKFLILDEPTNGLDIPNKQVWQSLLAKEVHDDQLVIVSTHQVEDIEHLIDGVVMIKEGKIVLNVLAQEIGQKLCIAKQKKAPDLDSVFYFEQKLGEYYVLKQNEEGEEGAIDLTFLFSAFHQNPQIAILFKQGENHA